MEIANTSKLEFEGVGLKHRGNGIWFKYLFLGDEDDPTNNYLFVLARQQSFYSPVHRHNFDQFRYPTLGNINILPEVDVRQGELCYHPEGVHYGPQDDGDELKEVLVLQFGGASGQGFVSHAKLAESQQRLASHGQFERGKFIRRAQNIDGTGYDESEPVDAFQALWEDQTGRSLVYPEGRYDRIIKMQPNAYAWTKMKGYSGVWKKTLGVFSERETRVEVIKIEKDNWKIPAEDATHLFYLLKGEGLADGNDIKAEWAGRIQAGKAAEVSTDIELQILHFKLPMLAPENS
ncbi:hypothetical protein N7481_009414 [Penicillium waksmanii]|uniref:uncharacterized protein n=1 Tax=Penicillium waksmanii TaxID=69791 RepID=UPI0025497079|nr:uncharacterized protein N7481_009414 [Penicillium waksmanii]KAJ5975707.1 hypothetical protein N7481_009414 [Penicillium waksmanii]